LRHQGKITLVRGNKLKHTYPQKCLSSAHNAAASVRHQGKKVRAKDGLPSCACLQVSRLKKKENFKHNENLHDNSQMCHFRKNSRGKAVGKHEGSRKMPEKEPVDKTSLSMFQKVLPCYSQFKGITLITQHSMKFLLAIDRL
jgi:hypothetical protein